MSGAIVVKLGGSAAVDPEPTLVAALARLAGERATVIVHGGGALVDQTLVAMGREPVKRDGLRVTPDDQIGVVAGVLAGTVNAGLVAALSAEMSSLAGDGFSAGPVGLTLGDGLVGDVVRAVPHSDEQLGCVGEADLSESTSGELLRTLLSGGWLPVVACIGSHEGRLLNVNADDAAAGVARAIDADRVLLLTDVPGVLAENGEVAPEIDESEAQRLMEIGVITGGMTPKVRAAVRIAGLVGCPVVVGHAADLGLLAGDPPGRGTVFRRRSEPAAR